MCNVEKSLLSNSITIKLHYVVILLLTVISAAGFAYTASDMDAGRDIFFAQGIASGRHMPLSGPSLAQSLHASPLWFYFLSIPLFLTSSWMVMNIWVGVFAALKFPLAYLIGVELGERNYGLLWAAFLALPGWHYFNYLSFTHTVMVEAAVLATLYFAIRWVKTRALAALAGGALSMSLALNAHPTAFILVFVLAPLLLDTSNRKAIGPKEVLCAVACVGAPFAPYIYEQALIGWPDFYSSKSYVVGQSISLNLLNIGKVFVGTVVGGWYASFYSVAGLHPSVGPLLTLSLVVLTGAGVAGFFSALWRTRRPSDALFVIYALVVAFAGVSFIRDFTPFYMTYALSPFVAGFMAYGTINLPVGSRVFRLLAVAAMILVAAAHVYGTKRSATVGSFQLAVNAGNVQNLPPVRLRQEFFMPVSELQALGAFMCSQRPAGLFGVAATNYELAYGVPGELECGLSYEDLRARHVNAADSGNWLGVPKSIADGLPLRDAVSVGNLNLYQVEQRLPSGPKPAIDFFNYPIRDFLAGSTQTIEYRAQAPSGAILAVSNAAHFFMSHDIEANVNGAVIEYELEDGATQYFRPPLSAGAVRDEWRIKITAPKPESIDINFLPTAADE